MTPARRFVPLVFFCFFRGAPLFAEAGGIEEVRKDFLAGYFGVRNGRYEEAIASLSKIRDAETPLKDYLLFYLGKAYHASGLCAESKEIFGVLSRSFPESRWAAQARRQASSSESCPSLTAPETEEKIVGCEERTTVEKQADCFFEARNYSRAKGLYQELAGGTRSEGGIRYLVRLSQSAARSRDLEAAIEANQTLRLRYPRSPEAHEALGKIAFLYQDAGRYREATPLWRERAESNDVSPAERRVAFERLGWCQYRLRNYREAVMAFDAAEGSPSAGYWKGRSLESLGLGEQARQLYETIAAAHPRTYYGIRALERMTKKAARRTLREWWPASVTLHWREERISLEMEPDLMRIKELQAVGLKAEAETEIRRFRFRTSYRLPADPRQLVFRENGLEWVARGLDEENAEFELPYAGTLFGELERLHAGNPFLLYAMMRQESHYREQPVSQAGAVGLLQVLPSTALRVAEESGWEFFDPRWLYEPCTNIEVAVRYLKELRQRFGSRWYRLVAAYSAGEEAVRHWLDQRQRMSEEEFIEEIPYTETREYVKRVYVNYTAYRTIYRGARVAARPSCPFGTSSPTSGEVPSTGKAGWSLPLNGPSGLVFISGPRYH